MRHFRASLAIALPLLFSTAANSAENRVWQPTVANEQEWRNLAVNERDTEFSKFVLDVKTGKIYFVDAHVFKLHIDFGLEVLLKKPRTYDTVKSFNLNYGAHKPQFILGYLTHYPKLSLWTYSFWEGDAIRAADVLKTQKALQKTFFAPNLTFRPDSLAQETMAKQFKKHQVNVIHNDKIYQKLPFQAFQTGQTIGTLRIVPPKADLDSLNFSTNDIVLLQETYPDINPVAGIITTKFSTPLAHVNLRATAWGIPNAGYKSAASEFAALDGQIVHYSVSEQGINLRAATAE